jgi:regulator of protease activity HflC (stomatin/prohibitin superfamily)
MNIVTKFVSGVVALFVLIVVFGSFYTVDEGERGVVTRYGEIVGISQPGLSWKMPIFESVEQISVRDHVALYQNLETYSRDQQPASMDISVTYRIDPSRVDEVYKVYGDRKGLQERLITRKVMEDAKTVFGLFNAESAIRERGRLNTEMNEKLRLSINDGPVIIVGVQVEDVTFSSAYEQSVEQRMLAEVAVHKERQNLDREKVLADIVRTQASAEADKVRFAAIAEAEAITLRGNAEAEAITARAEALKNNAALIELVKAENWDGKLPTTMLPNSAVPFIETGKN